MSSTKKLGLALSGGGYRAAAFHLGTLKKLHELGILYRVDVLSAISGGSIAGAFYCLNKYDFPSFEVSFYQALHTKNVIKGVLWSFTFFRTLVFALVFLGAALYFLFTPYGWLSMLLFILLVAVIADFQLHIFPLGKEVERAYDTIFYKRATLADLTSSPELVIGSTNLQTGKLFSFSRAWMQDPAYQHLTGRGGNQLPVEFDAAYFPVARAVMASSCIPIVFTPVTIAKKFFRKPERDFPRVRPRLVDGCVYENQGIHTMIQNGRYNCFFVISSDAGHKISGKTRLRNTLSLLMRTVNIFMTRSKSAGKVQDIYNNTSSLSRQTAYLSLDWDIENCIPGFINNLEKKHVPPEVIRNHHLHPDWVEDPSQYKDELTDYLQEITGYHHIIKPSRAELKIARSVPSNLTTLSKPQINCLMKQAAALTELQVKLYCPEVLEY